MQTTQDSYGKVVEKRISLEMERLKGSGQLPFLSSKQRLQNGER
jgi:hypothetical protein